MRGGPVLPVIVRVMCTSDGQRTPHDNRYIVEWDPHTRAGILSVKSSADPDHARIFSSAAEVLQQRGTISHAQSTRPWDGKPNRPLMALAVEIVVARTPAGVTRQ
jgi:hypothetical protein